MRSRATTGGQNRFGKWIPLDPVSDSETPAMRVIGPDCNSTSRSFSRTTKTAGLLGFISSMCRVYPAHEVGGYDPGPSTFFLRGRKDRMKAIRDTRQYQCGYSKAQILGGRP